MGVRRNFRLIHLTRWLGLVFVGAGFAAIALGWAGAARETCVDCQLPYLISGGLGGIGSIVLGVGLLIVAQMRTERVRLGERLEALSRSESPSDSPIELERRRSGTRRLAAGGGDRP